MSDKTPERTALEACLKEGYVIAEAVGDAVQIRLRVGVQSFRIGPYLLGEEKERVDWWRDRLAAALATIIEDEIGRRG